MNNKDEWIAVVVILFLLAALWISSSLHTDIQNEAVKRGFAEWKVIGKNDTKFTWKENAPDDKPLH